MRLLPLASTAATLCLVSLAGCSAGPSDADQAICSSLVGDLAGVRSVSSPVGAEQTLPGYVEALSSYVAEDGRLADAVDRARIDASDALAGLADARSWDDIGAGLRGSAMGVFEVCDDLDAYEDRASEADRDACDWTAEIRTNPAKWLPVMTGAAVHRPDDWLLQDAFDDLMTAVPDRNDITPDRVAISRAGEEVTARCDALGA